MTYDLTQHMAYEVGRCGGSLAYLIGPFADLILKITKCVSKIMDGEEPSNTNSIVTSVGNSWVLCRSKTYSGRIYYFNTETGQAAWNLSKTEIEKAKKRTKNLKNQPLEGCPEPQEPPMDHSNHTRTTSPRTRPNYTPSSVYNKQIINNQFTKLPFSSMPLQCTNCLPMNQVETLGMNLTAQAMFNPNIWSIPPTHQIFIAPRSPAVTNESSTPLIEYNNLQNAMHCNNTSVPLSRRFSVINKPRMNFWRQNHPINKYNSKFYNRRFKPMHHNYSPRYRNRTDDLRHILSAKKSQHDILESPETKSEVSVDDKNELNVCNKIDCKQEEEELCPSDVDDDWLKVHGYTEGDKMTLDISVLRKIAMPDSNSNQWYIVIDRNIILNHFKFMNILITSDEKCKLMVAREIFMEIQTVARVGATQQLKNRARHALRFLSQQFANGSAVIGEDSSNSDIQHLSSICLLNFCTKLINQDNHVILVSNEYIWQYSKQAAKVPIFTITEIKDLLVNAPKDISPSQMPQPIKERSIKITIPNNVIIDEPEKENLSSDKLETDDTSNDSSSYTENVLNVSSKVKEVDIQTESTPIMKHTVDAGVQTDFFPINSSVETDSVGTNTAVSQTFSNTSDSIQETVVSNLNSKKREIRLKRNAVTQITTASDNNKKQFKWHRRKRNVPVINSTVTSNSINKYVSDNANCNIEQQQLSKSQPHYSSNELICQDRQNMYEENSETSSCIFLQRNINENIIIEETSTSDISNTVSNVDSECVRSRFKLNPNEKNKGKRPNIIFEITDHAMEEYISTRCDEWISRYVQIMEEVLTQVLQQDTTILDNTMPPPWTVHEATECIKKRFSNNQLISDAASKLSNILFNISDARGTIKIQIKPAEFMEMYSYGLYLVNALQTVLGNSEDLQTALKSLEKLLNDIQNCNSGSHSDSFGDNINEPPGFVSLSTCTSTVSKEIDDTLMGNEEAVAESPKVTEMADSKSPRSYNLRSNKTIKEAEEKQNNVIFIRNFDLKDEFLSSLLLKKNQRENKSVCCKNVIEPVVNPTNGSSSDVGVEKDKEPRFIRNFSKCSVFEDRLKKKSKEPLNLDLLDYSIDYDDYNIEDYAEDNYYDDDLDDDIDESVDTSHDVNSNLSESTSQDINNDNFKWFIGKIITEIKEASVEVHRFCANIRDEISESEKMSTDRMTAVQEKAQKTHLHIENLCKSLKGIVEREINYCENDSQSLLQEAGVLVNAKQAVIYRDVVASCICQADALLESINFVIDAVKV
ncbi:uncharacterized protein ACR2FA_011976 [Aphomia sociella]